jgi:hypothetical protein
VFNTDPYSLTDRFEDVFVQLPDGGGFPDESYDSVDVCRCNGRVPQGFEGTGGDCHRVVSERARRLPTYLVRV